MPQASLAAGTGTVTSSYWDFQTTGQITSAAGTAQSSLQLVSGLPGGFLTPWSINVGVTFPFFGAAVLLVTATNAQSWLTLWGAHFYFWGRIVYAILYVVDWPLARSLVWNVPTIGILMNIVALFLT